MLFSTKQRSSEFEIFHHAFVLNLSLKDTLQNSVQMVQVLPVISYRKISEFPIFRIFLFCININKLYRNYNNKVKRRRRKKNKYHKRWQVKCVSDESCLSVGVSQVKSCPGAGGGGGTQQSFTGGVPALRSNPTIFDKKGTRPFRIPSTEKWYPPLHSYLV